MSNITLDELRPLLFREASTRRGSLLIIFVIISLIFLTAGFLWEKKFRSYVQLYIDDSQIVAPMLGAQKVYNRDQANVAQEELFSNEIIDRVLRETGHFEPGMSAIQRERVKEDLIHATDVYNINNQLLEFGYTDANPAIAYETTALMADLFLAKTKRSSTEETTDAFEFILSQVETYRNKLEDSERRLESFRNQYPGVSTTTEGNVEQRVVELRRDLERTQLQFAEASQRRRSLDRELSSESSTLASQYQTSQLRDQIGRLQAEVNVLALNYTEDYPDVVRLNQQIRDLTQMAAAPQQPVGNGQTIFNLGGQAYAGSSNLNPVYQQLRSDLARTAAEADSLASRRNQLQVLLSNEIERSSQSSRVERELSKLTRDNQINKELYEDLLRRQESARLSMSLGAEKQGVLYRIHQSAVFPILPTGLRFIHFALAGIVLASVLPFVLLFLFIKVDPRIRTTSAVTDVLQLPLLSVVPHMPQPGEKPEFFHRPVALVGTIAMVCVLYVVVFIIKFKLEAGVGGGVL